MKTTKLQILNFMALCCSLGLVVKKLVNPLANIITESLHIPGGISTGFSIMFLVIATEIVRTKQCGTLMGTVQGAIALVLGRIGSMGIFAPIGYMIPGMVIDGVYRWNRYLKLSRTERMMMANALAAIAASLTANLLVFHLRGLVLWLYICVSATSGSIYGVLGAAIVKRISPILNFNHMYEGEIYYEKS